MRAFLIYFIIFLSVFISGCNKPVPDSENLDPIYADLIKEKGAVDGNITSTEKQLEEFKTALSQVVPQTGQIKYAQKRVSETEAQLNKLRQNSEYLKYRIESRKKEDRENYLKAFNSKTPWPDPKEYESYLNQKKLLSAPSQWSAKKRIEAYEEEKKKSSAPPPKGGE